MLILTRRPTETIRIGDDISVTVLGVSGRQVRLGITAPKGVAVDREEIAIRKAGDSPKPAVPPVDEFCIDDRVRMAANARRYEWLRDREIIEDPSSDLLVTAGDIHFTGAELDKRIDDAMRLEALEGSTCEQ